MMNKMTTRVSFVWKNVKVHLAILVIANLYYLYFLIQVASVNIPQTDDFCFIATLHEYGFWGSLWRWYTQWQGRTIPQFTINVFLLLYEKTNSLLPYTIALISLFTIALYRIFARLILRLTPGRLMDHLFLINLSLFVFQTIIVFHHDTSTFYWLNVSAMYFGGMGMLLLGISELINGLEKAGNFLLISVTFLYAGTSAEHVGVFVVLGLLLLLLILHYRSFKSLNFILDHLSFRKVFVAFSCALIGCCWMYFAPGNTIRRGPLPSPNFVSAVKLTPTIISQFTFNVLAERIKYIFPVLFIFLFIGNLLSATGKALMPTKLVIVSVLLLFSCIAMTILGTTFFFAYIYGNEGVPRAYVHLSTLICLAAAFTGLFLGNYLKPAILTLSGILALFAVFSFIMIAHNRIRFNLEPTMQYARQWRQRLDYLNSLKKKGRTSPIVFQPIKYQWRSVLLDGEIACGPSDTLLYWANTCMEEALDLPFDVFVNRPVRQLGTPVAK